MKERDADPLFAAAEACTLLRALASPHRLMMVCAMLERERSVGELAESLGMRIANVSQHLTLLRKDGLVTARRDGQTVWYAIASPAARDLLTALHGIYCAAVPAGPSAAPARKPARTVKRTAP
ncbi:metalloregulator ArsR/SmtB family transcription factor [Rhodoplanes sp. TEM]|uniref:Metalloregulator ArsR/SmtB family transcription factor n=1 Tax=Rhodoplanes tepidamans TaxID=200616 RepID=A0ABT5J8T0_RHOTP|nr:MULTISPECIES: metalloregulator ArsR/SmtB family transcription factor [Rhodoplanes]MDC7785898.1 metalloregulator ArsR/SmtB family transcription factor [Rhodoplanes tepidamans]MDC7985010.1 metalloregulator ArsR/SmtB family transcription factor [Rhodoplanes sp. TEM]MDQ0355484.1 DNA-binding transcriptional ArsR family regulator [Rhodoplanes tepidamans]